MHDPQLYAEDDLLGAAASRLFADACTPAVLRAALAGQRPARAWQACADSGTADALVPESAGGAGLALRDLASTLLSAGYHAVPYPIADTLFARAWLQQAGAAPVAGSIAIAPFGCRRNDGGVVGARVPWLRSADHVLAQLGGEVWLLPAALAHIEPGGAHGSLAASATWPAGAGVRIQAAAGAPALVDLSACAHAAVAAGLALRILHLSLDHANTRQQFGKPIGRFQAIQQQLAVMAEQVWAARAAAMLALQEDTPWPRPEAAALARARTCEAIGPVCDIAHAVHGAIGVTEEHELGLYTRLLRDLRLAVGTESFWHARVGAWAVQGRASVLDRVRALCGEAIA